MVLIELQDYVFGIVSLVFSKNLLCFLLCLLQGRSLPNIKGKKHHSSKAEYRCCKNHRNMCIYLLVHDGASKCYQETQHRGQPQKACLLFCIQFLQTREVLFRFCFDRCRASPAENTFTKIIFSVIELFQSSILLFRQSPCIRSGCVNLPEHLLPALSPCPDHIGFQLAAFFFACIQLFFRSPDFSRSCVSPFRRFFQSAELHVNLR